MRAREHLSQREGFIFYENVDALPDRSARLKPKLDGEQTAISLDSEPIAIGAVRFDLSIMVLLLVAFIGMQLAFSAAA